MRHIAMFIMPVAAFTSSMPLAMIGDTVAEAEALGEIRADRRGSVYTPRSEDEARKPLHCGDRQSGNAKDDDDRGKLQRFREGVSGVHGEDSDSVAIAGEAINQFLDQIRCRRWCS